MHDLYFWVGGARQDRKNSDLELKTCIEKSGAIKQSRIMYLAVRAGSYSPIKYPKLKWNNGWDDERPIRALSAQDLELIEEELSSGYDFISEDLKQSFLHSLRSRAE
jgi:hypothetical protein